MGPRGRQQEEPAADPEASCLAQGYQLIAGVDEAGRGPLAGPVVAAAVILPCSVELPGLGDSKQLAAERRSRLAQQIRQSALAYKIVAVRAGLVDALGIQQASLLAMSRAVASLSRQPEIVLVDGPWRLPLELPQIPVVKGDQRCRSIAAASILAKVYRDGLMQLYHRLYPQYNFAGHKGYATPEHLAAIRRWGPCPLHRRTFQGVKEWCR